MKIGYSYIREALLGVENSITYKKFIFLDKWCRIKGTQNITHLEKEQLEGSEMEVLIMVRNSVVPILKVRTERNEAWAKKGVYTGRPEKNYEKFFKTLRRQVDRVLPEFSDCFEKRKSQIEREIYVFSAR